MKQNLVIFGNGTAAQLAKYYFDIDSNFTVVAFTVDAAYINTSSFEGLPLVAFETIEEYYPNKDYHIFIAVGYSQMNDVRKQKYFAAKNKGYTLASYVSSKCINLSQYPIGENAFILENTVIMPFAKIGNNLIALVQNTIAHHCVIEDHVYIAANALVGGHAVVKMNCFLGNCCTINPTVVLAEKTLVGAAAVITKNTEPESVYISPRSIKMPTKSKNIDLL